MYSRENESVLYNPLSFSVIMGVIWVICWFSSTKMDSCKVNIKRKYMYFV